MFLCALLCTEHPGSKNPPPTRVWTAGSNFFLACLSGLRALSARLSRCHTLECTGLHRILIGLPKTSKPSLTQSLPPPPPGHSNPKSLHSPEVGFGVRLKTTPRHSHSGTAKSRRKPRSSWALRRSYVSGACWVLVKEPICVTIIW